MMKQADYGEIILIRLKSLNDAAARLHSEPLVRALTSQSTKFSVVTCLDHHAGYHAPCILIFHYDDAAAASYVRTIKTARRDVLAICLSADIYNLREYYILETFVDFFLAPTELHRQILASHLVCPVYVLGEAIDRFDIHGVEPVGARCRKPPSKPKLGWFGYPESFDKSMSSIMPVIDRCVEQKTIERFHIITDTTRFRTNGLYNVEHFDLTTFGYKIRQLDYVVLSHFSLDLAVNTLIKSPNKAVTALAVEVIPLVSDTPNYGDLFRTLGLDRLLFSSSLDLYKMLVQLDVSRDAEFVASSGAVKNLEAMCSDRQILANFQRALTSFLEEDGAISSVLRVKSAPRRPPASRRDRMKTAVRSIFGSTA